MKRYNENQARGYFAQFIDNMLLEYDPSLKCAKDIYVNEIYDLLIVYIFEDDWDYYHAKAGINQFISMAESIAVNSILAEFELGAHFGLIIQEMITDILNTPLEIFERMYLNEVMNNKGTITEEDLEDLDVVDDEFRNDMAYTEVYRVISILRKVFKSLHQKKQAFNIDEG